MVIPDDIASAAFDADSGPVREWLATHDVNDRTEVSCLYNLTGDTLLSLVACSSETEAHVELARYLVAQGADATLPDVDGVTPLHNASRACGHRVVEMVRLLLDADGVRAQINTMTDFGVTPLAGALGNFSDGRLDGAVCRRCVALLLRAGASLDAIFQCREEDPQFSAEQFVDDWITFKKVSDFVATKELIRDFRAAGSWRAYTKGLRKQVLGLRSLALRDRAGTRDEVMKFIVKSPNEIAWKILSYWPTELDV